MAHLDQAIDSIFMKELENGSDDECCPVQYSVDADRSSSLLSDTSVHSTAVSPVKGKINMSSLFFFLVFVMDLQYICTID